MIKRHTNNEFYIKPLYNGYYAVIDGYDKSMASLECSKDCLLYTSDAADEL